MSGRRPTAVSADNLTRDVARHIATQIYSKFNQFARNAPAPHRHTHGHFPFEFTHRFRRCSVAAFSTKIGILDEPRSNRIAADIFAGVFDGDLPRQRYQTALRSRVICTEYRKARIGNHASLQ